MGVKFTRFLYRNMVFYLNLQFWIQTEKESKFKRNGLQTKTAINFGNQKSGLKDWE